MRGGLNVENLDKGLEMLAVIASSEKLLLLLSCLKVLWVVQRNVSCSFVFIQSL